MSKYNHAMSKLHFSEEGKRKLMKRIKENVNKENAKKENINKEVISQKKVLKFSKLSKVAVVVATLCLVSVTAYATEFLEPVTDILSPFFGGSDAQTEIIEQIGRPVGASDTDKGITITAEAIIGSKNHVVIVYKLSNEDGSTIVLPEDANQIINQRTVMSVDGFSGTDFQINGGMTGRIGIEMGEDGYYRIIETKSSDMEFPNGKNVTATFENLSYYDTEGNSTTFVDGKWKVKYEFSYEDMTTEIPVNQTFERGGFTFTVEQINISPISLDVDYTVNSVPDFMNRPIGNEVTDQTENGIYEGENNVDWTEHDLYADGLELFLTKIDGTIVDMTHSGGGLTNKETYIIGHKGSVLEEIIPLHEILSITVGGIEVFLD